MSGTDDNTGTPVTFTLDGRSIEAAPGETIWQAAARHGTDIPHLCYKDSAGYRADGNCRACMVEIEGERVLAASCIRTPTDGMVVNSDNHRANSPMTPIPSSGVMPRHSMSTAPGSRRKPRPRPTAAIRRLRSTWMPVSSATCAYAPAERFR